MRQAITVCNVRNRVMPYGAWVLLLVCMLRAPCACVTLAPFPSCGRHGARPPQPLINMLAASDIYSTCCAWVRAVVCAERSLSSVRGSRSRSRATQLPRSSARFRRRRCSMEIEGDHISWHRAHVPNLGQGTAPTPWATIQSRAGQSVFSSLLVFVFFFFSRDSRDYTFIPRQ